VLRAATLGAGAAIGSGLLGRAPAWAASGSLGAYDLVVVGSGAAGMTAALRAAKRGLSVVVVEKAPTFGGSTARSGAGIWIPNNSVILAAGVPDTPAKAAEYLAAVVGSDVPADRQAAFVSNGPAMWTSSWRTALSAERAVVLRRRRALSQGGLASL
jgi:3-oxosteroid 1-dehydrogenase